jgi:aryl-alcohol dehydrogenase-like predicted oxidoreductase
LYASWEKAIGGGPGEGASERALGEVLRRRGDRRQVIVITKGGHPTFAPSYMRPQRYLAPELVKRDLTQSLERMGLDMVDLYFLHRDDRRVPVGEIIDLLNELVGSGRIRYFGASNWSTKRIEEANQYAATRRSDGRPTLMGFVANQPEFSLAVPNAPEPADDLAIRFMSSGDLAWHRKKGFAAFCYSPTARGYFATHGQAAAGSYDNPHTRGRLARAQELARRKNATANQIALAWLQAQDFPCMPILGTTKLEHLQDGLAAASLRLSDEEVGWLAGG